MSTPHINPELAAILAGVEPLSEPTYAASRERADRLYADVPLPDGFERYDIDLGGCPTRVTRLADATPALILFNIHGGGYVAGRARYEDGRNIDMVRHFSEALLGEGEGVLALAPDYPLAPEDPHPAGREATLAALRATWDAYPGVPVVIYADSAGSGMAAQVMSQLSDEERGRINGAVLLEPCLDPTCSTRSFDDFPESVTWTRVLAEEAWGHYRADESYTILPDEDARVYPPVYVIINPVDTLRDEAVEWTFELLRRGFVAEMHMYAGTLHGYLSSPGTAVWERTRAGVLEFIREVL